MPAATPTQEDSTADLGVGKEDGSDEENDGMFSPFMASASWKIS